MSPTSRAFRKHVFGVISNTELFDERTAKSLSLRELKIYQKFYRFPTPHSVLDLPHSVTELDFRHATFEYHSFLNIAKRCPNLTRIQLEHCKAYPSESITRGLSEIMSTCPKLTYLGLRYCNLHDKAMEWMASDRFRNVTEINLSDNNFRDGLASLAAGCPSLQKLKLDECNYFTTAGLMDVAERCSHLKELVLSYTSERVLIDLAERCHELESIAWYGDQRYISYRAVVALLEGCPKIKMIYPWGMELEQILMLALRYTDVKLYGSYKENFDRFRRELSTDAKSHRGLQYYNAITRGDKEAIFLQQDIIRDYAKVPKALKLKLLTEIYKLNGRPHTPSPRKWAEDHAKDNMIILADALDNITELLTQRRVPNGN